MSRTDAFDASRSSRMVLRLLVAGTLVATAITVVLVARSRSTGEAEQLLRRAASRPTPDRYRFELTPQSAGLQACFSSRRAVSGLVDRTIGRAELRVETESVAAVIDGNTAYVHASVLTGWAAPTAWVSVEPTASPAHRSALAETLGPDLATFVLAGGLPASAPETAQQALEDLHDARIVDQTPTGERRIDATLTERSTGGAPGPEATANDVVLRFTIGADDEVESVTARLRTASSQTAGYVLRFGSDPGGTVASNPVDATPLGSLTQPDRPQPPRPDCEVTS